MNTINGSCLCGNIKYSASSEPLFMVNCHCQSCKKTSGSMFSALVGIPEPSLSIEGDTISSYQSLGDSGQPIRLHFCTNCGTLLFSKAEANPGVVFLRAGTIDRDFNFFPTANVYWRDYQDWLPTDIPCFETMPPEQ